MNNSDKPAANTYIDTSTDQDLRSGRIMVVDDDPVNVKMLHRTLNAQGYTNVEAVRDSREVVNRFFENPPDVILLDIEMPHVDGYEVIEQLKALDLSILPPIMVLCAYSDQESVLRALKTGARDYLNKPFAVPELEIRVRNMLEIHRSHVMLMDQKNTLDELVRLRTSQLVETQLEIVRKLARAAEYRDNETGRHVVRVSRMAYLMARKLGWSEEEAETLLHAASLHDVGKIGITDRILLKPGKLDDDEWRIMKSHTTIGAGILGDGDTEVLRVAKEIAVTHHERWDGSGYPNGVPREEIPISGRIVALVDVFDALTSNRPYKKAWSIPDTLTYIETAQGSHFDPELVELFLSVQEDVQHSRAEYRD
jgi:putative two-component system response regulator